MEIPQLALFGCGVFARDAYLPILSSLTDQLSLRFIWSRSEESAKRLLLKVVEFWPEAEAEWGEDGMERILASPEVHCCAIVLPILSQPRIVLKALRAGKHVLQEKPIAGTLKEGIETLQAFHSEVNFTGSKIPIWAVAENFRFEPAFFEARDMIKKLGTMVVVQVNIEVPMNASSKYFLSEWRRDPALKGAFITDCGVHFVAGLRIMLGGVNIVSVSGIATHRDKSVPPPDTLTTLFWRVVCSGGSVEVERGFFDGKLGYTVQLATVDGKQTSKVFLVQGLQEELKAFANDVRQTCEQVSHTPDFRSSPTEALQDLAIIETALSSGLHKDAPIAMDPPVISEAGKAP